MRRRRTSLKNLAAYPELPAGESVIETSSEEQRHLLSVFQAQDALLRTLPTPRLSAESSARIRASVLAAQSNRSCAGSATPRPLGTRRVWAMTAIVLLLMVAFGVTGRVAAQSLPGDPLYGVKRLGERVQLALTASAEAQSAYRQMLEERRRAEVQALLSKGREGISVAFTGTLQQSSDGGWSVEGVPVTLSSDQATLAGELVAADGVTAEGQVVVHSLARPEPSEPSEATPGPTAQPTPAPTDLPVARPTEQPGSTARPTADPTVQPDSTVHPTTGPTGQPDSTARPTGGPTGQPHSTAQPTSEPTDQPDPTVLPTTEPTGQPGSTVQPTARPTQRSSPTAHSTTRPTKHPSPTVQPAASSTRRSNPTEQPTTSPTGLPDPTAQPTSGPTEQPGPTTRPTPDPTERPAPTTQPTSWPTRQPESTAQPTTEPTARPDHTAHPTTESTGQPGPTARPTRGR